MLDDRQKFSSVKAPPFFSNLLPEGGLRKNIAQRLKIHEDREFLLLSALGEDLPGSVTLTPTETLGQLMRRRGAVAGRPSAADLMELKFSLGGMHGLPNMAGFRQGEPFYAIGRFDRPDALTMAWFRRRQTRMDGLTYRNNVGISDGHLTGLAPGTAQERERW